jgi:hypothetical protein
MATPCCDCDRLNPVAQASAAPLGSRAAPVWAVVVRIVGSLLVVLGALWSLPWHAAGSSGAVPVVFFSLAAVARAGARLGRPRSQVFGGSSCRRMEVW